jgi:hypothetical protein
VSENARTVGKPTKATAGTAIGVAAKVVIGCVSRLRSGARRIRAKAERTQNAGRSSGSRSTQSQQRPGGGSKA